MAVGELDQSISEEKELLLALRRGDEAAFVTLIDRYHGALIRLARSYVRDDATAEDVAQETWQGVVRGLSRFEGRSSLKTWIFRILVNRAMTRGERESRSIPFSSLAPPGYGGDEPSVDPDRFRGSDDAFPGHWLLAPSSWGEDPESSLLSAEVHAEVDSAIASVPDRQKRVITLRDIEGWTSEEVCNVLDITETNQRVLLHRARSRVRRAIEKYFASASV